MNDREALKHIKATIGAFGPDEGIELDQKAWSKLHSAIKEALAQPEHEPVGYLCENAVGHKYFRWKKPPSTYKPIALYTAHASPQRIWQGLTDEEVVNRANAEVFAEAFARGVAWAELKLKEKNT